MRLLSSLVLSLPFVLSSVHAIGVEPGSIKSLVTFGDSFTDIIYTGDHGTAWPVYTASYGNLSLHSYAIAGSSCDENLTPFGDPYFLNQLQLPIYFNDTQNNGLELKSEETLYTLWLGTNDVGDFGLLTGKHTEGTTIVQVTQCAVSWVKTLYDSGARNFLFQNMIPLELVPLYRKDTAPFQSWPEPHNQTEWSLNIRELTQAGNEIARLMLQNLGQELVGSHIGLFDSNSFFRDMIAHPENYLNGTAPFNVTGSIISCPAGQECTIVNGTDKDSYLWNDELHPSEQVNRKLAEEIIDVIQGKSRWTTWFS